MAILYSERRDARRTVSGARAVAAALLCCLGACVPPSTTYRSRAAAADSAARVAIAQERSLNPASIPINTVSVAPLTVISPDTSYASLGHGMAALLAVDLARSARVTVVERLKVDAVLRELALGRSGRVDTATAPRLGRLIGARRIVVGAMDLRSTGNLRMQSYIADATRGTISASLTGSSTLAQLFDAEKSLALRLFDALGVVLSPAERRLVDQVPTRSLTAFLAYSRGARAEANRDFAGAIANYAQAVRIDPGFAAAGQRLTTLQDTPLPLPNGGAGITLERIGLLSTDLVNRPLPITLGSGVDAPAAGVQQLITFTVIIRTP